ncbi:MAG: 30S ribosomal protein S4e [Candidatus Hermodarchaeia archaeon]
MAKGPRKHMKRLAAPRHWRIKRKVRPFTIRPNPGAHPLQESLPLGVVIRDMLNLTTTLTETRRVITQGHVKVDGRIRKDYKFPVGLMDVIEIPDTNTRLRVVPDSRHLLQLVKITKKEQTLKPCKITGKNTVAKGHVQLHLHDGRTILLPVADPKAKLKETYSPGDTLLIKLPDQTIQNHVPLKKGITAVITGGDHTGFVGKLTKVDPENQLGTLKGSGDKTILTAIRYVFPLGEDKPLISIPEAG